MNSFAAIDILNELLALESRHLLPRLRESTVFVSWASTDEQQELATMIDEQAEHRAWLVEAIDDLGGSPLPVLADIDSCDVHFLDVAYLLPRILANTEQVLASYEAAGAAVGDNPRAGSTLSSITERTQKHANRLRKLVARLQPEPPATKS